MNFRHLYQYSMSCLFLVASSSLAQSLPQDAARPARQALEQLSQRAEQFLQEQSATLPGQVSIQVGKADARLNLPACANLQAFFPNGSKAWGKTTVGVRCSQPAWSIFLQAQVRVQADYVAAAVPLLPGQAIQAHQLMLLQGDLTSLPAGTVTDMQSVLGRSSAQALAAGAPLRQDWLRAQTVIQSGQLVKLVASGTGFRVVSEARAINQAADGQQVQVKTAQGQQLVGIAQAGGIVQIIY